MIPENIEKKHIEQAIADIDKEGIRTGRHSSTYDLVHDGKHYPPKLVISIANRYANGEELDPSTFPGGDKTDAFNLLRGYGFQILQKISAKRCWAFHCNPSMWNITEELSDHTKGTWMVNKDDSGKIKVGDSFLLWSSGASAGIYAFGKVMSAPTEMNEDPERVRLYAIDPSKFSSASLRVRLNYEIKLQENPILRSAILNSRWLKRDQLEYSFFNRPQGVSSRELNSDLFNKLESLTEHATVINEFNKFLQKGRKNKSSSDDYMKKMAEVEAWFVENQICNTDFSIWGSESEVGRINGKLNGEKNSEWKKLNQERSNWFSAPWNKWQEYLQDSASSFQNESAFQIESSRFERADFKTYIDFLRVVVKHFGIKKGDPRVVFSVRPRRLNFTVGQRYCFNLYLSKHKGRFGAISIDKLREGAEPFAGVPPQPYYNYWKSFDVTEEEKQSILKGIEQELQRTSKSGYTKYNNEDFENYVFEVGDSSKEEHMEYPLNTILYGPPGTGKTYLTVKRAAEIISEEVIEDYDEALKVFNDNLHKRIEFITFHQNYSYEDFIQGLRPNTKTGDQLTFLKEDGVFKKIADRALKNLEEADAAPTELTAAARFKAGLDKLIDEIQDHEDNYPITDAVHIFEVEEDAFRYNGENWTAHPTGIRMKFSDLEEFFKRGVKSRKDVKVLENVSGLAKQHATYYFKVYDLILKLIPAKVSVDKSVQKQNFVIVIDEINRANISRVFGELITLIEPDKRSHGAIPLKAKLPSGDTFTVPSNLYIIGTMNTADKSIALLDIALRRRFDFEPMYPKYKIDGAEVYDADILQKINAEIIEGKGHDFQIGHAYFMGDNKDLVKRTNKKVIPLLLEYYMNDKNEVVRILTKAGLDVNKDAWPLEVVGKA